MIVGHGVDIMSISRIESAILRFGQKFLRRIYTEKETTLLNRRRRGTSQYLAALWAAKEAAMKALGTGARQGVRFKDIEILHEPSGKPFIRLYGTALETAKRLGADHMVVSLSHLADTATASVIFEHIGNRKSSHTETFYRREI
jgi:holo-[acyl-carrier protein] synthase